MTARLQCSNELETEFQAGHGALHRLWSCKLDQNTEIDQSCHVFGGNFPTWRFKFLKFLPNPSKFCFFWKKPRTKKTNKVIGFYRLFIGFLLVYRFFRFWKKWKIAKKINKNWKNDKTWKNGHKLKYTSNISHFLFGPRSMKTIYRMDCAGAITAALRSPAGGWQA